MHRDGYQTDAAIRSEVMWLEALARAGIVAPRPVRTSDDQVFAVASAPGVPGSRRVTVLRWLVGASVQRSLRPSHMRYLGDLMAQLQAHGAAWTAPPQFERPRLDHQGLLGPTGQWGGAVRGLTASPRWSGRPRWSGPRWSGLSS